MNQYIVNYSVRFLDGDLAGKLYHKHRIFGDWQSADHFKQTLETGFVLNDDPTGKYKADDVILSALENQNENL